MKRWAYVYAFAIALAVVLGYGLRHIPWRGVSALAMVCFTAMIAVAVVMVSYRLYYRPKPFTETRRYARAMYHSGMISLDELQKFYDTHPEDTEDGNTGAGY